MNATGPYWWSVNIASGNGLVPSGVLYQKQVSRAGTSNCIPQILPLIPAFGTTFLIWITPPQTSPLWIIILFLGDTLLFYKQSCHTPCQNSCEWIFNHHWRHCCYRKWKMTCHLFSVNICIPNKMNAIAHKILNAFYRKTNCVFWFTFHWRLSLEVKLTTGQHWFRYLFGAEQANRYREITGGNNIKRFCKRKITLKYNFWIVGQDLLI